MLSYLIPSKLMIKYPLDSSLFIFYCYSYEKIIFIKIQKFIPNFLIFEIA